MNKLQIYDRIKSTATATSATGNITLGSSVSGFLQPGDTRAPTGQWWPMLIEDEATGDWEVGFYPEMSNLNTEFGRGGIQVVLASSNDGIAVSFSTASEALTVSVIDPAEFVDSPRRYVDITFGSVNRVGHLAAHNDATTRFPLVTYNYSGFIGGQAAHADFSAGQGHVERVARTLTTTGNTAVDVFTFEIPFSNCIVAVEGTALIQQTSGLMPKNSRAVKFEAAAHYDGSSSELLGTINVTEIANDTGVTATVDSVYAGGLVVRAVGQTGENFTWMVRATATYLEV